MATKADKPESSEELHGRLVEAPDDVGLRLAFAEALHSERRFSEAVAEIHALLELDEGNAAAWCALGRSQNNLGNLEDAEKAFRRATELERQNEAAWNYLGHVLRAQGRVEAARDAFLKALAIAPDLASAHHNLATVYNELGELDLAAESFRHGLELEPDDPMGWQNLGDLLHVASQRAEAETCYQRVLAIAPGHPDALAALATLAQGRNEHEQAQGMFAAVLKAAPEHPVALSGMAWHLELNGEADRALELLERNNNAEYAPELLSIYARLLRRADRVDEAVALLEPWHQRAIQNKPVPIHLLFALGDAYDAQGRYRQAFECYEIGNQRRRARFDPETHQNVTNAQIQAFSAGNFSTLPVDRDAAAVDPVFIVGMPRSGTSLIEQILAAHPAVFACGERDWVYRFARSLEKEPGGYASAINDLDAEQLAREAGNYTAAAGLIPAGAHWITDKLPANFQHLGLISRLFPGARIIHCERNLMDTGLSCYRQNFKSNAMSFSHDLEHIGFYAIEYRRLMTHWQSVLPLPVLDVPYDGLVSEQETWTRKLIDFLDLPWDERCLRYYELDRVVNTASYEQARRPVFSSSLGQWRHYEAQLEPLQTLLRAHGLF